jgi:hypothetical protein
MAHQVTHLANQATDWHLADRVIHLADQAPHWAIGADGNGCAIR